jgi:hypothetical protein
MISIKSQTITDKAREVFITTQQANFLDRTTKVKVEVICYRFQVV